MKTILKKLGKFIFAVLLLWGLFTLVNPDSEVMDGQSGAVSAAQYVKHIDAWNVIWGIFYIGVLGGLFQGFNYLIDQLLKYIVRKKPHLSFLNSEWADLGIQFTGAAVMLLVVFYIGVNSYVAITANSKKVSIKDIPQPKPVVVLGTSKMLSSGKGENKYYTYRIDAAYELWVAGKVKYFILSGDGLGEAHADGKYNETRDMKNDLVALGVPEQFIKIDSLGLRTVDSSLRLLGVFKTNDVIFVSQSFHTDRAIVQSNIYGIKSVGYDAKGSATTAMWRKELFLSRPALIIDALIANVQPRVTGTDTDRIEFRDKFEVKSNRDVAIILVAGLVVLFIIIGLTVYIMSPVEKRRKVVLYSTSACFGTTFILGILAIQVYKTKDWKFVDDVVESFAENVGVTTQKMVVKQEKIAEITKVLEAEKEKFDKEIEQLEVIKASLKNTPKDSTQVLAVVDEPAKEPEVFNKKEKPTLFNSDKDEAALARIKEAEVAKAKRISDSLQVIEDKKAKKRNLFNSGGNTASNTNGSSGSAKSEGIMLKAKVNGNQKFKHNDEIQFRTSEEVDINGTVVPKNYVFTAKANVFDGKVHFIVQKIKDEKFKGENMVNNESGLTLTQEFVSGDGYFISDGHPATFKVSKL